jgi:putative phage-type endonuclease
MIEKYIGASQVAAVAGLSPWQTPRDVWAVIVKGEETEPTEAMEIGTLLEDDILEIYQRRHGVEVGCRQLQKTRDIYRATIDGYDAKHQMIIEAKTSARSVTEVPPYYLAQIACQMYVHEQTAARVVYLAAMRYTEFDVYWDDVQELWKAVNSACHEFWANYIQTGKEPPRSHKNIEPETIKTGTTDALLSEHVYRVEDLRKLDAQIEATRETLTALEQMRDALVDELVSMYGYPERLTLPDGTLIAAARERKLPGRVDAKRLKAEKPEIYEAYYVPGGTKTEYKLFLED